MKFTPHAVLAAAAIAIAVPSTASAQGTTQGTAVADDTVTTIPADDRDDDDFPWGLLGLLGLAGLLGRKRNEHVHVDRTDNVRR